ncbi:MAG: DeoR/GlpR transcriptional regulator [Firmicutes bacterium]|nr:DeoR/GlpR transcriptional regulator [Bacillota bacterium]
MSAKQEARAQEILRLLSDQKKMNVAAIAEMLDTSQVTIRKDLDSLEAKGFIHRVHGYAELDTSDHLTSRLAYHYDQKKKIAERASELVSDGDTIMIESGSCCAILADLLAKKCRSLTIITNSAFIAEYIRNCKQVQVILLGGIYQHESQCLVGPMIRDGAANYHVKHFFIGTDGWSEKTGFTNKDALRAQAVRDMAHSTDEVVILTESEKFSHPGTLPLNIKNASIRLITDDNLPEEAQDVLEAQGVQIG